MQGLTSTKISMIESDFALLNIKILCLAEVWFNSDSYNTFYFTNYQLAAHFYRRNRLRGGVGIWLRRNLNFETLNLEKFCIELDVEVCGVMCEIGSHELIVLCCYRSPDGNFDIFLNVLNDVLHSLYKKNTYFILTGDFNVNFLKDDGRASAVRDLLESFGMHGAVRGVTRANAQLDNIFSNIVALDCNIVKCIFSDHDYISCQNCMFGDRCDDNVSGPVKRLSRCFSKDSIIQFRNALNGESWPNYNGFINIDDAFNFFYDTFSYHFNTYFPERMFLKLILMNG